MLQLYRKSCRTELEPTSTPTSIDNSTSSGGTVRLVAIIVAALLIVLMIVVIVYFNIQPDPLPVDRKVYPGGYQGNGNGDTYGNFDDFRPAVKRKPSADIDEVDGGAPRVTGFNADGSIGMHQGCIEGEVVHISATIKFN